VHSAGTTSLSPRCQSELESQLKLRFQLPRAARKRKYPRFLKQINQLQSVAPVVSSLRRLLARNWQAVPDFFDEYTKINDPYT